MRLSIAQKWHVSVVTKYDLFTVYTVMYKSNTHYFQCGVT